MAGWTVTSTTGNIIPARRLVLLRPWLRPLRRRLWQAVSAAKSDPRQRGSLMGNLIGERVKSLSNECTGRRPVHFFQKIAIALAALMLASVPGAALAAAPQAQQQAVTTQTVEDFY